MKKKRKGPLFLLLKIVVIIILIPVALEAVIRVLGIVNINTYRGWGYSFGGYGDMRPNQNILFVSEHPYTIQTNSFGLRNSYEVGLEKPESTYRIIAIGDSFTFGPYVDNAETWPAQLERMLDERFAQKQFEVLNAGIAGYTVSDEYLYMEEKGIHLDPDLVIVGVCQNDVYDFSPGKRAMFERKKPDNPGDVITSSSWFNLIRDHSHLFALLMDVARGVKTESVKKDLPAEETELYRITFSGNCTDPCMEYWDAFDEYFEKLVNLTGNRGIELLVLVFPDYYHFNGTYTTKLNDHVESLCSGNNVPCLDPSPSFRTDEIDIIYLRPWNAHLSEYGYHIIAKSIMDKLVQEGMISI